MSAPPESAVYQLCLQRQFVARHFLIGGDWGAENEPHAHAYRLEVLLEGDQLDSHGFLVDLVEMESQVERMLQRVRGVLLNDLPEFAGLNPSLEHFARLFASGLCREWRPAGLRALTVRLWENDEAWASFRQGMPCA
jgi:6-pyruvoyltetrahydropterin/6-carboxytetrahydropterin synthase